MRPPNLTQVRWSALPADLKKAMLSTHGRRNRPVSIAGHMETLLTHVDATIALTRLHTFVARHVDWARIIEEIAAVPDTWNGFTKQRIAELTLQRNDLVKGARNLSKDLAAAASLTQLYGNKVLTPALIKSALNDDKRYEQYRALLLELGLPDIGDLLEVLSKALMSTEPKDLLPPRPTKAQARTGKQTYIIKSISTIVLTEFGARRHNEVAQLASALTGKIIDANSVSKHAA